MCRMIFLERTDFGHCYHAATSGAVISPIAQDCVVLQLHQHTVSEADSFYCLMNVPGHFRTFANSGAFGTDEDEQFIANVVACQIAAEFVHSSGPMITAGERELRLLRERRRPVFQWL